MCVCVCVSASNGLVIKLMAVVRAMISFAPSLFVRQQRGGNVYSVCLLIADNGRDDACMRK